MTFPSPSPPFCFEKEDREELMTSSQTQSELYQVGRSPRLIPCDRPMGLNTPEKQNPSDFFSGKKIGSYYIFSDNSRPYRTIKNFTFTVDPGLSVRVGAIGPGDIALNFSFLSRNLFLHVT